MDHLRITITFFELILKILSGRHTVAEMTTFNLVHLHQLASLPNTYTVSLSKYCTVCGAWCLSNIGCAFLHCVRHYVRTGVSVSPGYVLQHFSGKVQYSREEHQNSKNY